MSNLQRPRPILASIHASFRIPWILLFSLLLHSFTAQRPSTLPLYLPTDSNPFGLTTTWTLEWDDRKGNCGGFITLQTPGRTDILPRLASLHFKFEDASQSVEIVDESQMKHIVKTMSGSEYHQFEPASPRTLQSVGNTLTIRLDKMSYTVKTTAQNTTTTFPNAPLRGPVNVILTIQKPGNDRQGDRAAFSLLQRYVPKNSETSQLAANGVKDWEQVRTDPLKPLTEKKSDAQKQQEEDKGVPKGLIGVAVAGAVMVGTIIAVVVVSIQHRRRRLNRVYDPRYGPGFGL